MKNLKDVPQPEAREQVHQELLEAGIDLTAPEDTGYTFRHPAGHFDGHVSEWQFRREANKWVAATNWRGGIPDTTIKELHDPSIKITAGHGNMAFIVEITSLPALNAFAHLIKAFAKE